MRTYPRIGRTAVAGLLALAVGLAACGDDEGGDDVDVQEDRTTVPGEADLDDGRDDDRDDQDDDRDDQNGDDRDDPDDDRDDQDDADDGTDDDRDDDPDDDRDDG